jgi:hypothetical protein
MTKEKQMKKITVIVGLALVLLIGTAMQTSAGTGKDGNKNITLISAQSAADSKSQVRKELLEECIVSLPKTDQLEAEVVAETGFLKEINGEKGNNQHTKTYNAFIEINYLVRQKELIIITTSSVQGQEPVTKVYERNIRQSMRFDSDPGLGDLFAGQSNRRYYFSSAGKAMADVKARAAIWLKQQQPVLCPEK